jgi:hypothetical protein
MELDVHKNLCRYGGIYFDMDVILSNPLHTLHNNMGSNFLKGDVIHLNGAFMLFNRYRLGCLGFVVTHNIAR